MTPTQVSHWSRSSGPRVVCCRGEPQGPLVHGILVDPTRDFEKGFQESFRTLLEGTFSKTIVSVMPEVLWKLLDFRKHPETFEMTHAQVNRSSRSSGLPSSPRIRFLIPEVMLCTKYC